MAEESMDLECTTGHLIDFEEDAVDEAFSKISLNAEKPGSSSLHCLNLNKRRDPKLLGADLNNQPSTPRGGWKTPSPKSMRKIAKEATRIVDEMLDEEQVTDEGFPSPFSQVGSLSESSPELEDTPSANSNNDNESKPKVASPTLILHYKHESIPKEARPVIKMLCSNSPNQNKEELGNFDVTEPFFRAMATFNDNLPDKEEWSTQYKNTKSPGCKKNDTVCDEIDNIEYLVYPFRSPRLNIKPLERSETYTSLAIRDPPEPFERSETYTCLAIRDHPEPFERSETYTCLAIRDPPEPLERIRDPPERSETYTCLATSLKTLDNPFKKAKTNIPDKIDSSRKIPHQNRRTSALPQLASTMPSLPGPLQRTAFNQTSKIASPVPKFVRRSQSFQNDGVRRVPERAETVAAPRQFQSRIGSRVPPPSVGRPRSSIGQIPISSSMNSSSSSVSRSKSFPKSCVASSSRISQPSFYGTRKVHTAAGQRTPPLDRSRVISRPSFYTTRKVHTAAGQRTPPPDRSLVDKKMRTSLSEMRYFCHTDLPSPWPGFMNDRLCRKLFSDDDSSDKSSDQS